MTIIRFIANILTLPTSYEMYARTNPEEAQRLAMTACVMG